MKKLIIAAALMIPLMGFGQISGTSHDFSQAGYAAWNTTGQICKPCHTPHNAQAAINGPLWNHDLSTVGAYTDYTSTTLNGVIAAGPGAVSKACLTCHDGTVALGAFGGSTTPTLGTMGANQTFGTDLTNDHPIGITYTDVIATADGQLFPPTTTAALGGFIDTKMLFSTKVECASCHDVHGNGNTNLLLIANTGSALCLTCHNK